MAESSSNEEAAKLIAACDLVRAAGYAVVPKGEAERYVNGLQTAWADNRVERDQKQRLLWQVIYLTDQCAALLNGSRPAWYRRARRFLNRYEYCAPLVSGPRGEDR